MVKPVYVWTWLIDTGLCYFCFSTKRDLLADGKPSPEAKPIKVKISMVPRRKKRKPVGTSRKCGRRVRV